MFVRQLACGLEFEFLLSENSFSLAPIGIQKHISWKEKIFVFLWREMTTLVNKPTQTVTVEIIYDQLWVNWFAIFS